MSWADGILGTDKFREDSGGPSVRPMETAEVGYSLRRWIRIRELPPGSYA
jgi:hypothetical protein